MPGQAYRHFSPTDARVGRRESAVRLRSTAQASIFSQSLLPVFVTG